MGLRNVIQIRLDLTVLLHNVYGFNCLRTQCTTTVIIIIFVFLLHTVVNMPMVQRLIQSKNV